MLQVYNTLSREKENFIPIKDKEVKMYVCGITVYDHCHIGHARTFIAFDMIRRYLTYRGYQVDFVRNITDIDDKIINRSLEMGIPYQELVSSNIKSMHDDLKSLNTIPANHEPKATEFMPSMISMVKKLIDLGFAYVAANNDVYYQVAKFNDYGKLAKRSFDDMESGARVDINPHKKDPMDFVLWKSAKPGEPSWESPWGKGRPGWHLECSAMSMDILGDTFDIHGGGYDLIFPHHENECAQSEALSNKPLANYWFHIGFLQMNQEKMSKSLGNIFLIKDVLKEYHVDVLRYFMINGHYRSSIEYNVEQLESAKASVDRLYTVIRDNSSDSAVENTTYEADFKDAMDDDFNSPKALSILFNLVRDINKSKMQNIPGHVGLLIRLANTIGILYQDPKEYFTFGQNEITSQEIESLIIERNQARADKNYKRADEIREYLADKNIVLEDKGDSTGWKVN